VPIATGVYPGGNWHRILEETTVPNAMTTDAGSNWRRAFFPFFQVKYSANCQENYRKHNFF